mgnify:FL=1
MDYRAQIGKVARRRIVRVALVSIIGIGIQSALFELLGMYLKVLSPSTAVIVGAEVGLVCNFFLINAFVFHGVHIRSTPVRLLRFHISVSGSLLLQWLFVFTAEHFGGSALVIHAAYLAGIGIGFFVNYAMYTLWVWQMHSDPVE